MPVCERILKLDAGRNFYIKYKDKTGAHTITGEYRNLFDCVYR